MTLMRFVCFCLTVYYLAQWLRRFFENQERARRGGYHNRVPAPPPSPPPQQSARQVLGVAPGASAEEIRAAYQALVRQYHPDQVSHLGPELREVAERRTKEITAAYNVLKGGGH